METALLIPRPGAKFGSYPERLHKNEPWPFYPAEMIRAFVRAAKIPSRAWQNCFLQNVKNKRIQIASSDPQFITNSARHLRGRLAVEGFTEERSAEAFALIDAAMQRELHLALHDTQFLAGWLLLDRRLIEMHTGEGKTLAVALAAATGALAGIPVHVITANDYLVERDAAHLRPVFELLGLTVGTVTALASPAQRRDAYRCDITYCTAKELAFDYLRDHLAGDGSVLYGTAPGHCLRGLCMAIIDEADSVLIDEARMPLVLASAVPNREQSAFYRQALFLAAQLTAETDYRLDLVKRSASLTPTGEQRAVRLAGYMGNSWSGKLRREEMLCLALAAQHLFVKDRDYVIDNKQVVIVDQTTGRLARGRTWSRGLQQLIELKEGCTPTDAQQTSAQTTFQRFFARYLRLSGVSGTLAEASGELLAIYGLPIARVPLRLPCRRIMLPSHLFLVGEARWHYVVNRVRELNAAGRPVLIGTDSVADSESLSSLLTAAGISHTVLNAHFDGEEAAIVAQAGQVGAVTVATNMAGRGTDIALSESAALQGGLHVIACQSNRSGRIDRQLYGRCARQGDQGSVEHLYCIEHAIRCGTTLGKLVSLIQPLLAHGHELPSWLALFVPAWQSMHEKQGRRERWFLFFNDRLMGRQLAFAGRQE